MARREKYDFIAELCTEWVSWLKTRRFYINSYSTGSTLNGLVNGPGGGRELNGRNYPDMQYFNMAIHTCSDMEKYKDEWEAFKAHYLGEGERTVAKRIASDLGVCRRTYYNHIKKFAEAAYSMSLSLKKAHETMTSAVDRPALVQ